MIQRGDATTRRQGAVLTVEMLLLLPLLLILFFGFIELTLILVAESKLNAAAQEAARQAALGVSETEITTTIEKILGVEPTKQADITLNLPSSAGQPVEAAIKIKGSVLVPDFLCFIG